MSAPTFALGPVTGAVLSLPEHHLVSGQRRPRSEGQLQSELHQARIIDSVVDHRELRSVEVRAG